jgi:sn-glycerol 3-phosphate transport system permease protein
MINGTQAMLVVILAVGLETGQLQLHLLPRRPAIHPALGDRGGADGRGARPGGSFRDHHPPAALARPPSSCWSSTSSYCAFDTFGTIQAMTQGGPGKSTETLVVKVYRDGVVNLDLGGSSAQSVVLMLGHRGAHRRAVPLPRAQARHTDGRTTARTGPVRHTCVLASAWLSSCLPGWLAFVGLDAGPAMIGQRRSCRSCPARSARAPTGRC